MTLADGQTARLYYFVTNGTPVVQIVTGSGNTWYMTLAEAVAAYNAGTPAGDAENDAGLPYIQLQADAADPDVTMDKPVYLDLNGQTVTLTGPDGTGTGTLTITGAGVLYGMDSTTNKYEDKAYGKIFGKVTVQNGGSLATAHETFRIGGARYRYVTMNDTENNKLSFHRYNMSVTKYEFHFRPSGQCDMDFGATFQGSPTVVRLLEDMGFRVEKAGSGDSGTGWWTKDNGSLPKDLESGDVIGATLINIGSDQPEAFKAYYDIIALLRFDGGTEVESVPRNLNYLGVLKKYYNGGASGEEQQVIDAFVTKNGLQDAWEKA